MMQTSASVVAMSLRAIERFYHFSSGEKMKSQGEASVLNQPCAVISYKKKSSRLRLWMLRLFRYFSCHTDDLSWWFALLAPEVCKLQTCFVCLEANRDTHLVDGVSSSLFLPLIHMFSQSLGYYGPQSRLLAAS